MGSRPASFVPCRIRDRAGRRGVLLRTEGRGTGPYRIEMPDGEVIAEHCTIEDLDELIPPMESRCA